MSKEQLPTRAELLRYVEGEVAESRAKEIRDILARSDAARREIGEIEALLQGLRQAQPELEKMDLVNDLRLKRASQQSGKTQERRPWLSFVVAAALASLTAVFLTQLPPVEEEIAIKAAGQTDATTWIGIQTFVVEADQAPVPLSDRLPARTALLFSYNNGGPLPFRYLAVFAFDGDCKVFWYYPAYTDAATNPSAIKIKTGANIELPDLVRQPLKAGALHIVALFSDTALHVEDMEKKVAGSCARAIDESFWRQQGSAAVVINTQVLP